MNADQNVLFTHGVPLKIPNDLRQLVHNLRSVEDVRSRVDKYFDALDDSIETIGQVLNESTANREETARNLKDYFVNFGHERL